ncbi:MAG: ribonuclease HII [Syntrophaceae bacterium]
MPLEEDLIAQGVWPVCGVDEAGRGPLAGPVVAAAAVLTPGCPLRSLVRDSKVLSASQREALFELLMADTDVCVGVAIVDARTIDEINIFQATMLAMRRAVVDLKIMPSHALIDGNHCPELTCASTAVIGGDATEPSISAASIVAKVTRDRLMASLDITYPGYGFARHKGYPTRAHHEAIRILGPCPIHRRSYKGVTQLQWFS